MNTVLGIDVGTQSVKVLFYDFDARRIAAISSVPLDLIQSDGGVAEQEASWWTDALQQALTQIDDRVRSSVRAISVSGQQHGFVAVDDAGDVVAPVKLWCDTSTNAECTAIMDDFGGAEKCLETLGNRIAPGYTASKIRWLRDHNAKAYARMRFIMLPHDYLNYYLTGVHCMEAGDASGTGLLNVSQRSWSTDMLRAVDPGRDLSDCLPDVRIDNESIGRLRDETAAEFGLPAGIPVAPGGGDNMMAAIGTGCVVPGRLTMSLGTSGTVFSYSDSPVIDSNGDVAAFCSSTGGWLPLLCTMNCTASTELMRGLFGLDIDRFEAALQAAPEGAGGVITVPFFNGERTPNLPDGKACVTGLDSGNLTPENLLRSTVEGATFGLRYGFERLTSLGVTTRQIVLTGGGSKSATWRQMVADVCASPVQVPEHDEGAAFGAALQALSILEGATDIRDIASLHAGADSKRSCEPSSSASGTYNEIFDRYQQVVRHVSPLYS